MQTCMAILKASDLETVRRQQVKNILTKQAAGKTLSAREERILAEAATDAPPGAENFVKTYDELATRLGVSRKSIQNWQKKLPDNCPRPRADGRHEVAAWVSFMAAHHLAASDPDGHPDDRPITIADWKARELELKCEKLQIENSKVAGELIAAAEVETGLSQLVSAFRQALNNLGPRLAAKILNVTDYHEAEEIVTQEINVVLKTLQNADFLGTAPAVNPVPEVTQPAKISKQKSAHGGRAAKSQTLPSSKTARSSNKVTRKTGPSGKRRTSTRRP